MNITVLSGSPRDGNTASILREMLKGPASKGLTIKGYVLHQQNIQYCIGCKTCCSSGVCIHDDDVPGIVKDMFASQYVIVASPSYWGDVTGQLKVFIDRCTPYGNTNGARIPVYHNVRGIGVAVRAGNGKAENERLIGTIEHFLGHLDIPLVSSFTAEGIDTADDLRSRPELLEDAYRFGLRITNSV